jgi:hypothetical protein
MSGNRKRPLQYSDTDNENETLRNDDATTGTTGSSTNGMHNNINHHEPVAINRRIISIERQQHYGQADTSNNNIQLSILWEKNDNDNFSVCTTAIISCLDKKHQAKINKEEDNKNIEKETSTTSSGRNDISDDVKNDPTDDDVDDDFSTVMIVLQGRGFIEVLPYAVSFSENVIPDVLDRNNTKNISLIYPKNKVSTSCFRFVDINGYRIPIILTPQFNDTKNDNTPNDVHQQTEELQLPNFTKHLYFESYRYGSWVTVLLPTNTSIRISSCCGYCQNENSIVQKNDMNIIASTNNKMNHNNNNNYKIQHQVQRDCTCTNLQPTFKIHCKNNTNYIESNNEIIMPDIISKPSSKTKTGSTNNIDYSYYGPSIPNTTTTDPSITVQTITGGATVRPTIYPSSWQDTCSLIVNEYCQTHYQSTSSNPTINGNHQIERTDGSTDMSPDSKRLSQYHFMSDQPFDDDDDHDKDGSSDETSLHDTIGNNINVKNGYQVLILGDRKQVGTSTVVRYCINRFLSAQNSDSTNDTTDVAVIVLDANPDRPEFFLSGIIGLTELKSTLVSMTKPTMTSIAQSSISTASPILFPTQRSVIYSTLAATRNNYNDDDDNYDEENNIRNETCQKTFKTTNTNNQRHETTIQSTSCIQNVKSYYFGSCNVTSNPQLYLQYFEDLVEVYYDKYVRNTEVTVNGDDDSDNSSCGTPPVSIKKHIVQVPPLIIHLGNWSNKDFGSEIVSTILSRIIHPNHIILVAADGKYNMKNEFHNSILSSIKNDDVGVVSCNTQTTITTNVHWCKAFYDVTKLESTNNNNNNFSHQNYPPVEETNGSTVRQMDYNHQGIYDEVDDDDDRCSNDGSIDDEEEAKTYQHSNTDYTNGTNNITSRNGPDMSWNTTNGVFYNNRNQWVWTVPAPIAPISASVHRAIPMVSYFSLIVGNDNNNKSGNRKVMNQTDTVDDNCNKLIADKLSSAIPYVVPYDLIDIRFTLSDTRQLDLVNDSSIFAALNGSIVALCITSNNNNDNDTNSTNNNNNNNALIPCIGIGIVRSVDEQRRLLYILTPCSLKQLHNVDVLMVSSTGDIVLPLNELVYQGPYASSFPYQSFATTTSNNKNNVNSDDDIMTTATGRKVNVSNHHNTNDITFQILGTEPMKSRNTIGRRSLMQN